MRTLYARALARQLPLLGGGGDSLPDRELTLDKVEIDREHLADYDAVCGFRYRDELPPTYLHVVAFPLALELMTARDFPLKPIGLVHVANRIEQRRRIEAGETLSLRVRADDLREHPRGTQFDVVAEAGDAWLERSTYLRRERPGMGGGEDEEPREASAVWRVTLRTARRYAAVSGDRNPIHLHRLAARAFGHPRPIAHGMWLKARCVAALEARLPPACAIEVRFGSPLRLPASAGFASWPDEGGRAFAVHAGRERRKHISGVVTAL
ncbi:MAG TPA: MaoC/PaaZ C-terminal domain-containing protein [Solirubrobacteraceae bacterium]